MFFVGVFLSHNSQSVVWWCMCCLVFCWGTLTGIYVSLMISMYESGFFLVLR